MTHPSDVAATFRKNKQYVANLKKYLNTISKKVYAEGVALTLDKVVRATYKDSGRAAANWNISFGSALPTSELDPKFYEQAFNQGAGRVGKRGDGGTAPIAEYKAYHYGYTTSAGTTQVIPHGRIYQAIKPGVSGSAPAVYIHNPILSQEHLAYANNAFKSDISEGDIIVSLETLSGRMAAIIHETAMELRFPATYKR